MPDSNARRDKALESIAGSLGDIVGLLKKIEQNTRSAKFTNYPAAAAESGPPDPFGVRPEPQLTEPGKDGEGLKPTQSFVQSSHPYFKPSGSLMVEGSYPIE